MKANQVTGPSTCARTELRSAVGRGARPRGSLLLLFNEWAGPWSWHERKGLK